MSKELVTEEIIRLLESIVEQTQTVNGYQGKIPQIEIDIIQDNIRQLYQYFMYLDKINQGSQLNEGIGLKLNAEEKTTAASPEKVEERPDKQKEEIAEMLAKTREKEEPEPEIKSGEETQGLKREEAETAQQQHPHEDDLKEKAVEEHREKAGTDKEKKTETDQEQKKEPEAKPEEETRPESKTPAEEQRKEKKDTAGEMKEDADSDQDELKPEEQSREEIKAEKNKEPAEDQQAGTEKPDKKNAEPKDNKSATKEDTPGSINLFSQKKSTLAEKLQNTGKASLYDRIGLSKQNGTLGERLKKKPVTDIKTAIGINEKFLFINELFKGNMHEYNDAIKRLNRAGDLENAALIFDELQSKYNWSNKATATQQLLSFVERRYM